MWFKKLTGFDEHSPEDVYKNLFVEGNKIVSKVNNRHFQYGALEVATLSSLKQQAPTLTQFDDKLKVSQVVTDVQSLHCDPSNKHALFQAASQFNLLEMVGPDITPEEGITRYAFDNTQGPACAIACGAGTIYRNYFAPINGRTGQTSDNQIDCLDLIGEALHNHESQLWLMRNGYALVKQQGLLDINSQLAKLDFSGREALKELLKIGVQWNTEVTIADKQQLVSQAYCSALPVAYLSIETFYWQKFASLILEATYEATLYAALINLEKTGSNKVFLTLVGGGAFGNELSWILDAMKNALEKFGQVPLDVNIVSYGYPNQAVDNLTEEF